MNTIIKALDREVISTLDRIFIDTWREPLIIPGDKCDIVLNDAWIEIINENLYIVCDIPDSPETARILIFPNSYSEVVMHSRASQ